MSWLRSRGLTDEATLKVAVAGSGQDTPESVCNGCWLCKIEPPACLAPSTGASRAVLWQTVADSTTLRRFILIVISIWIRSAVSKHQQLHKK